MTPLVACGGLSAAFTRAGWNAPAHSLRDQLLSFTLVSGGGLLIGAVAAPLLPFPDAGARRWAPCSSRSGSAHRGSRRRS